MSSNVSHEVKGTIPQFAILDEHLDTEFGPGVWIMILSMLGFLIGVILIIVALIASDDEGLHTGLIILAISGAGISLGIGITYLKEKSGPKSLTKVMHGLTLKDSQFKIVNCKVELEQKKEAKQNTGQLVEFSVQNIEQTLQDRGEPYKLAIGIAVNEQGALLTGNDFRIASIAISQGENNLWSIDHHKKAGMIWLISKEKSFHLPMASIKKKKLIKVFEDIYAHLCSITKPQIDVHVSFLLPGANIGGMIFVFGLVGGATSAFFDWQTTKSIEEIFKDSPLSYQENEENIIDTLKQNRWKFRIIK